MDDYIITASKDQKEVPMKGLRKGEKVDLSKYECRHIYPKDWIFFKQHFPEGIFDPDITYFLDMGFEIRIYRKKTWF